MSGMSGLPTPGVAADVARSVARRFDAPTLAAGTLVILGLALLGGLGLVTPAWHAPREIQLSRFIETAVAGLCVFVAVIAADELADRGAPRLPTYSLAVAIGAVLGAWLGWEVRSTTGLGVGPLPGVSLVPHFAWLRRFDLATIALLVGGLATFVHVNRRTALTARRRQHAAERARALARRHTLESQLQALQARVEPVFLFDTLTRIRALYREDGAVAGAMLEDLTAYLRAALPHMRESTSTVEQETTLVRSWLDIVRRAHPDWRVRFRIAEEARPLRLPALVLLPLVQQAVAATRGPLAIDVEAVRVGDRLQFSVATNGRAFGGDPAGMEGADRAFMLQEVGDRIRALYGAEAELATRRTADGSEAVVRVPIEPMAERPAESRA